MILEMALGQQMQTGSTTAAAEGQTGTIGGHRISGRKTSLGGAVTGTGRKGIAAEGMGSAAVGGMRSGEGTVGERGSGSAVTDMTAAETGTMTGGDTAVKFVTPGMAHWWCPSIVLKRLADSW